MISIPSLNGWPLASASMSTCTVQVTDCTLTLSRVYANNKFWSRFRVSRIVSSFEKNVYAANIALRYGLRAHNSKKWKKSFHWHIIKQSSYNHDHDCDLSDHNGSDLKIVINIFDTKPLQTDSLIRDQIAYLT